MKASLRATVLLSVGLTCSAASVAPLTHTDVFVSGKDGYHSYRIPAIETAPDGSIIAFAEARKYNANDPGYGRQDIDLVYKRSMKTEFRGSYEGSGRPGDSWSAANPATLVDRSNGMLWVFYYALGPEGAPGHRDPERLTCKPWRGWSADNGRAVRTGRPDGIARDLETRDGAPVCLGTEDPTRPATTPACAI